MNKDNSLKSNDQKIILLMVGNDDTGKKSISKQWMSKNQNESEESRTFYKTFSFLYEDVIEDEKVSNIVEIRVMNGDEIDTELKINSAFFKGALGAFVVTSIEDFMSFQE